MESHYTQLDLAEIHQYFKAKRNILGIILRECCKVDQYADILKTFPSTLKHNTMQCMIQNTGYKLIQTIHS